MLHGWLEFDRARLSAATYQTYDADRIQEGIRQAQRALLVDPGDARGLELRGTLRFHLHLATGSAEALRLAEEDLRAVADAEPPRARALSSLADLLRTKGQLAEAAVWARRALEADPFLRFDELTRFTFSQLLMDIGEIDEALPFCEEGHRRSPENAAYTMCLLVALATAEGPQPDVERAWKLLADFEKGAPTVPPYGRFLVAAVLARAQLTDSAKAVLERARAATEDDPGLWTLYYEANTRILLDERDVALSLLARFLESNPDRKGYIAQESWWRPLHGDPTFDQLVAP